jgi:serine/threonine protein kinase
MQQPAEAPATLGPYRIEGTLGRGGMGVVYRATHTVTGEPAAVKTVVGARVTELRGLRREVHALMRLRHSGIVRILDQGVASGLPWYAMELLVGDTLASELEHLWTRRQTGDTATLEVPDLTPSSSRSPSSSRTSSRTSSRASQEAEPTVRIESPAARAAALRQPTRPFASGRVDAAGGNLREALELVRRICAPLAFLHANGVVHRDIKPDNVFLRADGSVVLVDFGVAAQFAGAVGREVLEVGGSAMGTPWYMSPEQINGDVVDPRADLYALGCVLYELVTGQRPYLGRTPMQVFYAHLNDPLVPASALVQGVPPALDELLERMLQKRARHRVGYAEDVADALAEIAGAVDIVPAPESRRVEGDVYLYAPELAGRSAVLTDLRSHVIAAATGEGSVVFIGGESGVGKTRLAREVANSASRRQLLVVTGECTPLATQGGGVGVPLSPLRPLLLAVADRCREKGPNETARLLSRNARLLAPYEPSLLHVPGLPEEPEPAPLPPDAARGRLVAALLELLGALALAQPVLLVLDDVQWADEITLSLLRLLKPSWIDGRALFVLATYRAEESGPRLVETIREASAETIELGRLDPSTVAEMAADMLALPAPSQRLGALLTAHTEGNPFFVAEYLRAAVSEGLVRRSRGGGWQVQEDNAAAIGLPSSLRDLIIHRFAKLTAGAQRLLCLASVLGRELDAGALLAASDAPDDERFDALAELVGRQIVSDRDGKLRFAHDKLREVAYAAMEPDERRKAHGRVALALEATTSASPEAELGQAILAHHFAEAGVRDRAIHYLDAAGDLALRTGAAREAITLIQRAILLDRDAPVRASAVTRARWERRIAEALFEIGDLTQSEEHGARSLAALGEPLPRLDQPAPVAWAAFGLYGAARQAAHLLAPAHWIEGDAKDLEAKCEAAAAANVLTRVYMFRAEQTKMIATTLLSANYSDRAGSAASGYPYGALGIVAGFTGLHGLAHRYFERARGVGLRAGDRVQLMWTTLSEAVYAHGIGAWSSLERLVDEGLTTCEAIGHKTLWEMFLMQAASMKWLTGRIPEAIDCVSLYRSSARARGAELHDVWGMLTEAGCVSGQGRFDEAETLLIVAKDRLPALNDIVSQATCASLRAHVRLRRHDLDGAATIGEEALTLLAKGPPTSFGAYTSYTRLPEVFLAIWERAIDRGDHARARLAKERALACCAEARRYGRLYPIGEPAALVWTGRAERLAGHTAKAKRTLEKARSTARKRTMPYEEALAEVELGQANTRDRAAHLARAAALFERLGFAPHLDDVRRRMNERTAG